MRIATWNVNSLKARMDRVLEWLDRAQPDVLLMQETKLSDEDAPVMPFQMRGYKLVHHGEGRWNGVAIASKSAADAGSVITNFGNGPVRNTGAGATVSLEEDDFDPSHEARMVSAVIDGMRFVSLYAPNGRVVGSAFFDGKLKWYGRLLEWLQDNTKQSDALVVGGDMNIAPTDMDVWDANAVHGGTHVSQPSATPSPHCCRGASSTATDQRRPEAQRFTWWDYRAGNFHKNLGMRIDHLLLTQPVAQRLVWAEIDREARKGVPIPSDHAPLFIDIDTPGLPLDAGWEGALKRIAARTKR